MDEPSQYEPVKSLIVCPNCGLEMCLFGIEPQDELRELYTFECERCRTIEVRGVRLK